MEYRGLTLDPFQEKAVKHIERDHSLLVAAPTGTGKTLIADYLTESILENDGEVIYTAPVKALSNQKYREYTSLLGQNRVGLVTGDHVENREAPVRIMTTEILRNMLLEKRHENREAFASLQAVVIDEIHYMDDPARGTVWEELLIYLPTHVKILGLSATLSNLDELAGWLSDIRDTDVKVVRENTRAVPLNIRLASQETSIVPVSEYDRRYETWKNKSDSEQSQGRRTRHTDVVDMLPNSCFPALYFIFSRKLVEKLSSALARGRLGHRIAQITDQEVLQKRLEQFEAEHPEIVTPKLKMILEKGIGFHHAGIHVALKSLIEELYEERLLTFLYCTSTFALGINMPARTVIFDSLTKYNGTEVAPLKIREFMQMAGRAGRRGIDEAGDVIIRQNFDDYEDGRPLVQRLMSNESEPITSSFNLSFYSVVNLLRQYDETQIQTLLEQSFKAYRRREQIRQLEKKVAKLDDDLAEQSLSDDYDLSNEGLQKLQKQRWKRAALKRKLAESERPKLWETFQKKVSFLRAHQYIDAQNKLLAPANILRHIKIESIFVTELILEGVLEQPPAERIFGIMCGLVLDLPRKAKVEKPSDDTWWEHFDQINDVYEKSIIADAEKLMGRTTTFTPEVMPLAERWAYGESLQSILEDVDNSTDLSGDIVSGLRRAKDLTGQLIQVTEQKQRRDELKAVIKAVSRDEVEVLD